MDLPFRDLLVNKQLGLNQRGFLWDGWNSFTLTRIPTVHRKDFVRIAASKMSPLATNNLDIVELQCGTKRK